MAQDQQWQQAERKAHWVARSIGAVVVGGAAFLGLHFWDMWELSLLLQIGLAMALGLLFLAFGGSLWDWIDELDTWF